LCIRDMGGSGVLGLEVVDGHAAVVQARHHHVRVLQQERTQLLLYWPATTK
jgi:hypothetical protein